ncbi:MAG: ankyrin repeat domain-containing protein [Bryobacteraceae bacterium]
MQTRTRIPAAFIALPMIALPLMAQPATAAAHSQPGIRAAAERALARFEDTARVWTAKQQCISCHNQTLPMMALASARRRGIAVNEDVARSHSAKVFALMSSIDTAVQANFLIDPAMGEGYALMAAHAAGVEPSLTTAIYANRIANWQRADGHWPTFDNRPPHSASAITATAVASRAVALYMPAEKMAARRSTLAAAAAWLAKQHPTSTEDLSYQLMGLMWTGASKPAIARAAAALRKAQLPGGGWAQMPGMAPDAYATGQALVALASHQDAAWNKGIQFLMRTQAADGTWCVKTRLHSKAPISPPYFETGFPYGKDQIISTAGSAWATMALLEALPMVAAPGAPLPVPEAAPVGEQPWMRAAMFGPAAGVKEIDPNAATQAGTTVMMMTAHDPAKTDILIGRGASVTQAAKTGFTPLMVAATYRNNSQTLRLLIGHGAQPNPGKGVMFNASPLAIASIAGDIGMMRQLIAAGADLKRPMMIVGMIPVTPLFIATDWNDPAEIELLVKAGAEVNSLDSFKMTPLSAAVLGHREDAARTLLDLGASTSVVDTFGLTPMDHAAMIDFGDPGFVNRLTRKSAHRD